jgi:capsular exopolysaccharide synthesis family protein
MSLNYEILRCADAAKDLFQPAGRTAASTPADIASQNGNHPMQEEILKLVQRIFGSKEEKPCRTVVFSAVESGNGCSWICARVAETLAAHTDGSVCVVDGNVHSPSLHRHFGVDNKTGLMDLMHNDGPAREFARQIHGGNLWLVPSGIPESEAHTMLRSDYLRSRLAELQSAFNYVLIDAPPMSLYADALMLGQMADGMVMVVEANATRREAAHRAKEYLEAGKVKLLGAVLNKRTFPIPESIYKRL